MTSGNDQKYATRSTRMNPGERWRSKNERWGPGKKPVAGTAESEGRRVNQKSFLGMRHNDILGPEKDCGRSMSG